MDLFGKKAQEELFSLKKVLENKNKEIDENNKVLSKIKKENKNLKEELKENEIKEYTLKEMEEIIARKTVEYKKLKEKDKKEIEDCADTIRLQCQRIEEKDKEIEELKEKNKNLNIKINAANKKESDLGLQIKSLIASNNSKQLEIEKLKEDKEGKIYLEKEKEKIKKFEEIAKNTKKRKNKK